jgi:hypothetical protein
LLASIAMSCANSPDCSVAKTAATPIPVFAIERIVAGPSAGPDGV